MRVNVRFGSKTDISRLPLKCLLSEVKRTLVGVRGRHVCRILHTRYKSSLVRNREGKEEGTQDGSIPQEDWQAHPEETAAETTEAIITERLRR